MLVLLVADVLFLSRIEEQVTDRSNQDVDTAGDVTDDEVPTGLGGETFGLQGSVVDDQAADPTKEEGQQKASKIFVIH